MYHLDYCEKLKSKLLSDGIRVELDDRDEKLSHKMRESQTRKIPYTIIIGDKEKEDGTISYRLHGDKETKTVSKEEFINILNKQIKEYK